MGWADGSGLMKLIVTQSRESISIDNYMDLIEAFEEYDCDTLEECFGISNNFDIAYFRNEQNKS